MTWTMYDVKRFKATSVCFLAAAVLLLSSAGRLMANADVDLYFACKQDNNLYTVVGQMAGQAMPRFDSAAAAIAAAPRGAGVLVLADGYPHVPTAITAADYQAAQQKGVRLYVEYPAYIPNKEIGDVRRSSVERGVVGSNFFGDALPERRILAVNGLHYLPVRHDRPHLVASRVAGFDYAEFGLPAEAEKRHPLLFELEQGEVLVATTCLSRFIIGRYTPKDHWQAALQGIVEWLQPDAGHVAIDWKPLVRPTYGRDEPLPEDFEMQAIRRAAQWFEDSKLLIHPSFVEQAEAAGRANTMPALPLDTPVGDGSLGIMEAIMSIIEEDGSQPIGVARRGDCTAESAMALAFAARLLDQPRHTQQASNLLDYYLFESIARKNERGDPNHGAYGLIAWGITTPAWYIANYSDDNARLMMGVWATAALNNDDRWDEAMMMCLLANLRTTGRYGFRIRRINVPALANGWESYFASGNVEYWPHFDAYLWACYLWAYEHTGDELFLNRARTALTMTMAQHTDGWRWTNGLAQERARIILPLAWLVRVDDTPEHRAMLRTAVDGLLALQDESGAIQEELGMLERGSFPPPQSNDAYGTTEASLIANNGDPVADLLYTTNFAFFGLHEAAAVLDDPQVYAACDRLAAFLCRIQIQSDDYPYLDGGWFRAFDFNRWEHWGSNADNGWGAWCIESGWTQGWILSVLAMRQMNTTLWELTSDSTIGRHHARLKEQMMPEAVLRELMPKTVEHAGRNAELTHINAPHELYPDRSESKLLDGMLGTPSHADDGWVGLQGEDLNVVIDLGKPVRITTLASNHLESTQVGIYLPRRVTFSVSQDGSVFRDLATVEQPRPDRDGQRSTQMYMAEGLNVTARYVRVTARNIGTLPAGHRSSGVPAWLFTDEVLINPQQ